MYLEHYTMNTGDTRSSPRSEVDDSIIKMLRRLIVPGEYEFPKCFDGYRLSVPQAEFGYVASVFRGDVPLITMGVADTDDSEDEVWPELERFYLTICDKGYNARANWATPRKPARLPWCATAIVGAAHLGEASEWIGDFERCLAWTWIER